MEQYILLGVSLLGLIKCLTNVGDTYIRKQVDNLPRIIKINLAGMLGQPQLQNKAAALLAHKLPACISRIAHTATFLACVQHILYRYR